MKRTEGRTGEMGGREERKGRRMEGGREGGREGRKEGRKEGRVGRKEW